MIRACLYCGKEFESSQGWICDRKYCSKECGNAARRIKYYEERKNRICKQCGKPFVYTTEIGHAWFCSDECAKRWTYEHDGLRKAQEGAIRRCAEWLQNGVPDNFTVLSEWTEDDGNVEIEIRCNDCGGTFKKQIYLARHTKHCPLCWKEKRIGDSHPRKYGNMDDYKAVLESKRQESFERKEKERIDNLEIRRCVICNIEFETTRSSLQICCSSECSKKRTKHRSDKRIAPSKRIDKGIDARSLFRRDKGVCWICGEQCNLEDYTMRDGYFIAGDWYPSVDHIIPICEGGEDSWKNVKLAHRICNSLRYVKEKKAQ